MFVTGTAWRHSRSASIFGGYVRFPLSMMICMLLKNSVGKSTKGGLDPGAEEEAAIRKYKISLSAFTTSSSSQFSLRRHLS